MTPLVNLRHCSVRVSALVLAVTILMLIMCSKVCAICWQASYKIDNKVKSNYWKHDTKNDYQWIEMKLYHCMSRHIHISSYRCTCRFRCRWFWHNCCIDGLLRRFWYKKRIIMHHRWMSRRLPGLCQNHDGLRYSIKPLHVVCCTLSRSTTNMSNRCKVLWKLKPSIVNVLYR